MNNHSIKPDENLIFPQPSSEEPGSIEFERPKPEKLPGQSSELPGTHEPGKAPQKDKPRKEPDKKPDRK